MPPPAPPSMMKLLVDTTTGAHRVVFAEAGKDVADFILGLVAMPLGAAHRLAVGSLGSIGNVYASAEKMDAVYMQSTAAQHALLFAGGVPAGAAPLLNTEHQKQVTRCRCDACHASKATTTLSAGFVKDTAKYTVMDDLTVTPPVSDVSSVALLKSLGVRNLDALEERSVNVGHEEAMDILRAALRSKTVLTEAFLKSRNENDTGIKHERSIDTPPSMKTSEDPKSHGWY